MYRLSSGLLNVFEYEYSHHPKIARDTLYNDWPVVFEKNNQLRKYCSEYLLLNNK